MTLCRALNCLDLCTGVLVDIGNSLKLWPVPARSFSPVAADPPSGAMPSHASSPAAASAAALAGSGFRAKVAGNAGWLATLAGQLSGAQHLGRAGRHDPLAFRAVRVVHHLLADPASRAALLAHCVQGSRVQPDAEASGGGGGGGGRGGEGDELLKALVAIVAQGTPEVRASLYYAGVAVNRVRQALHRLYQSPLPSQHLLLRVLGGMHAGDIQLTGSFLAGPGPAGDPGGGSAAFLLSHDMLHLGFSMQGRVSHSLLGLAALLRDPAGAAALLGRAPDQVLPMGLAAALRACICDPDTRDSTLLAALEVPPCTPERSHVQG